MTTTMTGRVLWLVLPKRDRKSTRLNSSHVKISYAVFCLKKKTTLLPRHGFDAGVDHGVAADEPAAARVADDEDVFVFFFNDTATTEIYTLSLHDALPI